MVPRSYHELFIQTGYNEADNVDSQSKVKRRMKGSAVMFLHIYEHRFVCGAIYRSAGKGATMQRITGAFQPTRIYSDWNIPTLRNST